MRSTILALFCRSVCNHNNCAVQSLASALAISSSRRSAEEGGVTGASVVLNSVSSPQRLASWASFPLASAGNCSWSSRMSRSTATKGTSRDSSPCPPPSAIIRQDVAGGLQRARACVTFRETSEKPSLTWQLYVYVKTSSGRRCNR